MTLREWDPCTGYEPVETLRRIGSNELLTPRGVYISAVFLGKF